MMEDYVRTARAKGLRERDVVVRHALRNALGPLVTLVGLDLGVLLGGAVVTEYIFAWPGIGREVLQAVLEIDISSHLGRGAGSRRSRLRSRTSWSISYICGSIRGCVTKPLPKQVWLLGGVSFFADVSSEMIYPLLPMFIVAVLGRDRDRHGVDRGHRAGQRSRSWRRGPACAAIGFARRMPWVRFGYILPVVGRALLVVATSWPFVLLGRTVDRLGKGFRSSPARRAGSRTSHRSRSAVARTASTARWTPPARSSA